MQVALLTTFAASKKEPLSALLERIHAAFVKAGAGEPSVQFSFADGPISGFVSSVDRVLKRFPELKRFTRESDPLLPGGIPVREISNADGEMLEFATLLTVADGVPRSFPFHTICIQFTSPAFGDPLAGQMSGVVVRDSWWVNGRERSLAAVTVVEAPEAPKKIPALPEPVAAILAVCGKVKRTVPFPVGVGGPSGVSPELLASVRDIVQDYRSRLPEIVDRAGLPHDLPSVVEARRDTPLGEATGPKKPALVRAFKPLGYDCQAASGTFTLERKIGANLTARLYLDVGTWSRSLTATFGVVGLGFKGTLLLPVSRHAAGGEQYPIGGGERWQQLVDNLAALVKELDRTFVPAIEQVAGNQ